MEIGWSFNEMMLRGKQQFAHAQNDAANGEYATAAEYMLQAVTIFEIASEAQLVKTSDMLTNYEYAKSGEWLESSRKYYLTYRHNALKQR